MLERQWGLVVMVKVISMEMKSLHQSRNEIPGSLEMMLKDVGVWEVEAAQL